MVKIESIQAALINWGKENYADFSWRSTENKFHALIAEVMLQRTRAEQVEGVYTDFIVKVPSLDIDLDLQGIREVLRPLGLNWRIDKIVELLGVLKEIECIPFEYSELVRLPGIGDYAASAYLSFHANTRRPLIDSNAIRLWGRVFGIEFGPETRRKRSFRELIDAVTPTELFKEFNYAVLDLTRAICKPKPLCNNCPLSYLCTYFERVTEDGKKETV